MDHLLSSKSNDALSRLVDNMTFIAYCESLIVHLDFISPEFVLLFLCH
jgi:hypothetical protein